MNTFSKMFNIATPAEAKAKIQAEIEELGITEPKNLERTGSFSGWTFCI